MINSTLYVFDRTPNVKRLLRYSIEKNIGKIFVCPITTNQDATSLIVKHLSLLKNCKIELIPFLEYFHKLAFSERDNFIRFISEFGEKARFGSINFREYFKFPYCSFSAWWLSLITEKNPQKSDSCNNLVKLLAILRLRGEYKCKGIILDVESRDLSCAIMANSEIGQFECNDFKNHRIRPQIPKLFIHLLKGLRLYFDSIHKYFIVYINTRGLNFRKEILRNAQYIAITYFPLVDRESLKQKRFVNKYYGLLQTALENKYKGKFIWLAMASSIDGFNFKDSVKLGRQLNLWNYPIYFLEEWITPKDMFTILASYIYITIKCIIKIPYLAKNFEYSKKRIKVWKIFEQDWFSSFAGSALMSGIFYLRAFQNISNRLKKKAVVTYLAENQTWERALNSAFHSNKDLKSIGILHTTVPLLSLRFFDSRDDLRKDGAIEFTMPKPDYLACNGKIPLKLFQASGWDEKKAFLWFAIRYQHLKKYLQKRVSWQSRQNKILVALSSSVKESKELLYYIHQAFCGQTGYQVIIKAHYTVPVRILLRRLDLDFNKNIFVFSNEQLDRLLPLVKAMVVSGSSAALESIAFGCPVIIPRLSSAIDVNPLSGISDLPLYVQSPRKLQDTVDEIMKGRESPVLYEKCKEFIENYFEFSDSESELIEKIESRFVTDERV